MRGFDSCFRMTHWCSAFPLMALVLVAVAVVSASSSYPTYVYGVSPTGVTNMDRFTTLRLLGGRPGDVFYLIHSSTNCTNPPVFSSGKRTWLSTIGTNGVSATPLAIGQLVPGPYRICYLSAHRVNMTSNSSHRVGNHSNYTILHYPAFRSNPDARRSGGGFSTLPFLLSVGGMVDRGLSSFSCSGNFSAGSISTCTILLRDGFGNPTGSTNASCRISLCPFLDGRGSPMQDFTPPAMNSFGTFVVNFMPREAGCLGTLGVSFDGKPIANRQAFFKITAGVPASNRSTSECRSDPLNGTILCAITQRDYFDNAIKMCVYNSDGGAPTCTAIN